MSMTFEIFHNIICVLPPFDFERTWWLFQKRVVHTKSYVVSSNPVHGKVYLIHHYVKKFVSDLQQVGGFLQFPPPIKQNATI